MKKFVIYALHEKEMSVGLLQKVVALNHTIFLGMYNREPYNLNEYLAKIHSETDSYIIIARANNWPVGDSIAFERDDSLYIWILGVAERWRKHRIGSDLMNFNERRAKKRTLESVTAKVYRVSDDMMRMLEKRGYEIKEEIVTDTEHPEWDYFMFEKKI